MPPIPRCLREDSGPPGSSWTADVPPLAREEKEGGDFDLDDDDTSMVSRVPLLGTKHPLTLTKKTLQ